MIGAMGMVQAGCGARRVGALDAGWLSAHPANAAPRAWGRARHDAPEQGVRFAVATADAALEEIAALRCEVLVAGVGGPDALDIPFLITVRELAPALR
jgi:hypothetical protein